MKILILVALLASWDHLEHSSSLKPPKLSTSGIIKMSSDTKDLRKLGRQRRTAANQAFDAWKPSTFECDDWSWDGDCASRAVYYKNPDDPDGPRIKRTIHVWFEPGTAEVTYYGTK